jgi:hypothetical protein
MFESQQNIDTKSLNELQINIINKASDLVTHLNKIEYNPDVFIGKIDTHNYPETDMTVNYFEKAFLDFLYKTSNYEMPTMNITDISYVEISFPSQINNTSKSGLPNSGNITDTFVFRKEFPIYNKKKQIGEISFEEDKYYFMFGNKDLSQKCFEIIMEPKISNPVIVNFPDTNNRVSPTGIYKMAIEPPHSPSYTNFQFNEKHFVAFGINQTKYAGKFSKNMSVELIKCTSQKCTSQIPPPSETSTNLFGISGTSAAIGTAAVLGTAYLYNKFKKKSKRKTKKPPSSSSSSSSSSATKKKSHLKKRKKRSK